MKKNIRPLVSLILFLALNTNTFAQCSTAGQFPSAVQTLTATAPSTVDNISTCNFTSEHSAVTGFMAGSPYTAEIVPGGYVTINSGTPTGPLVAMGVSPVAFIAPTPGPLYFHWTDDGAPNCGGTIACFTTNIINNTFPTPVRMESFTASKTADASLLEWTTSSEQSNSHFNVQRSSDGRHYTTLDVVYSKAPDGESSTSLHYEFLDLDPEAGTNYYRLEQVDINGQKSLSSNIELIWGMDGHAVSIYPNPSKGQVFVDIETSKVSRIQIQIFDVSGKVVHTHAMVSKSGMNSTTLALDNLSNGLYLLQLSSNGKALQRQRIQIVQ